MWMTQWDQTATKKQSENVVGTLVRIYLERCGTHRFVDEVRAAVERNDKIWLRAFEIPYAELTLVTVKNLAAIQGLFQKYLEEDPAAKAERSAAAWTKFKATEVLCANTNRRFRGRRQGLNIFDPVIERVLWHAQRKISRILGDVPALADLKLRFGPGASTTVKKSEASSRRKLGSMLACSDELSPHLLHVLAEVEGWLSAITDDPSGVSDEVVGVVPVEIHTGQVVFVPKNAQIDRVIIVEPNLNGLVQLGIMDHMVARLRREGVDLSDQSRNQRLAQIGSVSDALATLDLSSASDTVSTELVYDLLPLEWASFLARYRTGTVTCEGEDVRLEKFSSMGNGFTFPLQSLLFYALSIGCCEETGADKSFVSVYGDDIVIPTLASTLLVDVLRICGFIPNQKKSFLTGPFRESCGKDYFLGIDVRPFFLRGPFSGESMFSAHNHAARQGDAQVASAILAQIDRSLRLFGPDGYGDGHLISDVYPKTIKKSFVNKGFEGHCFDTFSWKPKRDFRKSFFGDRALPLYTSYMSSASADLWTPTTVRYWGRVLQTDYLEFDERASAVGYVDNMLYSSLPGDDGYHRISIYTLR